MVLVSSVGYALQRWVGLPDGLGYGVILGLLAGALVPARSCSVR